MYLGQVEGRGEKGIKEGSPKNMLDTHKGRKQKGYEITSMEG